MNKVNDCANDNCIHTPTSCSDWNGGDIQYLGICDGDSLNNLLWEIITKLQELAGEDLSTFDLDALLDICNQKAPTEKTIISILELVKNNQVCLKDYINSLSDRLNDIFGESEINVNLKCYAQFDNLGNSLAITRDQLDQLIIDNLCNHKQRIESLEGNIISLQSQINNIDTTPTVDELSFATCVNAAILPTSTQVINTSQAHCDLEEAAGTPADIASAISKVPSTDNARYGLIPGWDLTPENEANVIGNLLLKIANLEERLIFVEGNCCAATCDSVRLGFSAVYNEDSTGILIKFTSGAGTSIPAGFEDVGSTGTITDIDGNIEEFTIDIVDNFTNATETEVIISGLNLTGPLTVDITAKIGNDALVCEKCIHKTVNQAACAYCEVCAAGDDASSAVIVYVSSSSSVVYENSTTTTTTVGV